MEIKIDLKALEALFPEGSEGRLKLQQCVIEEFTKRHIKCLSNELNQKLIQHADKFEIHKFFTGTWTEAWALNAKGQKAVHDEVERVLNQEIAKFVQEFYLKELESTIQSKIESALKYNIGQTVQEAVRKKLNDLKEKL